MSLTQTQIDNVQIDFARTYLDYGLVGERYLGPSRGGGEFKATGKIRDIEYDGNYGKTKGMQVIEEISATLSVTILDTQMDNIALAIPYADYTAGVVTAKTTNIGLIPNGAYVTNVTTFCKTLGGAYKKITIYNGMSESDFDLKAKPKGEGEIALDIEAHWDAIDDSADLYKIEDVANINGDTVKPTIITVPADAAPAVIVTSNQTAVFSKDIKQSDINSDNFILIKASDGTIVAGALTYTVGTKTALFNPTSDLTAATAYIWTIARVRDLAGNIMLPVVVNFTTAT
jgi:hypothetical protein